MCIIYAERLESPEVNTYFLSLAVHVIPVGYSYGFIIDPLYGFSFFKGPFKKYITRLGGEGLAKKMTKCDIGGEVYAKE